MLRTYLINWKMETYQSDQRPINLWVGSSKLEKFSKNLKKKKVEKFYIPNLNCKTSLMPKPLSLMTSFWLDFTEISLVEKKQITWHLENNKKKRQKIIRLGSCLGVGLFRPFCFHYPKFQKSSFQHTPYLFLTDRKADEKNNSIQNQMKPKRKRAEKKRWGRKWNSHSWIRFEF